MGLASNTTGRSISISIGDGQPIRIRVVNGKLRINSKDLHEALGIPNATSKELEFKGAVQIALRSDSEYGTVVAVALGTLDEKYPYFKIRYS